MPLVSLLVCSGHETPGYFKLGSLLRSRACRWDACRGKWSLYADGALYLNDAGRRSCQPYRFDTFGSFSGIRINWSESTLFLIDDQAVSLGSPLQ